MSRSPLLRCAFVLMAAALVGAGMFTKPVRAQDCNAKAAQLAAERGGTVLSVQSTGTTCVVKLLIPSGDGAPKRVTLTVPN